MNGSRITRRDFYAAIAILAVALFAALKLFGKSEYAAEWVAAIGTIAAVFAAIWVGQRSVDEERSRIAARGRVIAFRLAPHIVTIRGDIGRAREALEASRGTQSAVFNRVQEIVITMGQIASIPPDLFGETWTLPPQIALAVAQLESQLSVHYRLIENFGSLLIALPPEQKAPHLKSIETSLYMLDRLALTIKNHCAAISDEVAAMGREPISASDS